MWCRNADLPTAGHSNHKTWVSQNMFTDGFISNFGQAVLWGHWYWTPESVDNWHCARSPSGAVWRLPCQSSILSHNTMSLLQPMDHGKRVTMKASYIRNTFSWLAGESPVQNTAYMSDGKRLHILKAIHSTQKTWNMCPRLTWIAFSTKCSQVSYRSLWHQNELSSPTEDQSRDAGSHRWHGGDNGLHW